MSFKSATKYIIFLCTFSANIFSFLYTSYVYHDIFLVVFQTIMNLFVFLGQQITLLLSYYEQKTSAHVLKDFLTYQWRRFCPCESHTLPTPWM